MLRPRIHALVRPPTAALAGCALTYVDRRPIDGAKAAEQHREYVRALKEAGARVVALPEEPELPDAPFVEDTLVVVGGVPLLARPADAPRRRELPSVARGLERLAEELGIDSWSLARVEPPGTLEGGDVLVVGARVFVGVSGRTNREGVRRLAAFVDGLGAYRVTEVPVTGCLHLKTAVTRVAERTLLAHPEWIDVGAIERAAPELEILPVDPREPFAANTLRVGGTLLASASHPRTLELLARRGLDPRPVDVSELEKAEAGLTCLSVLVEPSRTGRGRSAQTRA